MTNPDREMSATDVQRTLREEAERTEAERTDADLAGFDYDAFTEEISARLNIARPESGPARPPAN
jgi:hypothetical protein